MRPKKHETTGEADLFRARLDQIIDMKHELVQLAGRLDWDWLDGEIAPLYSDKGRPGIETRFVIGLLLLKHIFALSDEEVCERWVYDPYFQYFTGEEFFQHAFPHERSDLSHWRKRRSRAPTRSVLSSSASAAGSCIPSTLPRSSALARARPAHPTSSASRPRSLPPCSRARRPVRAARQNAAGQPL